MSSEFDFVVIGGGIAGASVAAHLAEEASVLLLEMESQPGYHTTGRSAALFLQTYGNAEVRALTRASRDFFYRPAAGFAAAPLVTPRAVLITARVGQEATLQAFTQSIAPEDQGEPKSAAEALALLPVLRTGDLVGAIYSHSPADIDVDGLLQGYLRLFRTRGGVVHTGARLTGLKRARGAWAITAAGKIYRAPTVVNAAGAWAGEVARLAGAQEIGLRPLRRTVCLFDPPTGSDAARWPMLLDVEEQFYLKYEAGKMLLSPADETLAEPGDAQAEELDIAIAVERLERATTLHVKRIVHKWAGLRSFVEDRSPVVGYDGMQPGFFWLAALGGYGIQTAPALSRLAAALALRHQVADDLVACGVNAAALDPRRLRPELATLEQLDEAG